MAQEQQRGTGDGRRRSPTSGKVYRVEWDDTYWQYRLYLEAPTFQSILFKNAKAVEE